MYPFDVYGSTNSNISNEMTMLRRAFRKVTLERDEVAEEIRLRHIHAFKDGPADLRDLFETFYSQLKKQKKRNVKFTNSPSFKS